MQEGGYFMKKNSNFKNISYTNFEFISLLIICVFAIFLGNFPEQIVSICGSGSIMGVLVVCFVAYFIYRFTIKKVFENEYDFYEIIRKTYPQWLQKVIGVILYLFCMMVVYIMINNIVINLKSTTYRLSETYELAIYFLLAIFFMARSGFNAIFRIAGYIAIFMVIYFVLLFVLSIPFLDITNFFPLFGNGFKNIFLDNLTNLKIFSSFFFLLFFGGTIFKGKPRAMLKNFHKIFGISSAVLLLIVILFLGSLPLELITSRNSLIFDISRLASFSTTSIKLAPAMIFIFSIITYITTSFIFLVGCMSLERLKVIKDYSKVIILSMALLTLSFFYKITSIDLRNYIHYFGYISNILCFVFPVITVFFYLLKKRPKSKKFLLKEVKTNE